MIKLKQLIKEEKEAFRLEKEGKLKVVMRTMSNRLTLYFTSENGEYLNNGYIILTDELPPEMFGNPRWRSGYLFVDHVVVNPRGQGYGYLLYKAALNLAKEKGYSGLASYKKGRSNDASDIWKKLTSFSDSNYDYLDIKDLGTRLKETYDY